jgi:hypothetical protein
VMKSVEGCNPEQGGVTQDKVGCNPRGVTHGYCPIDRVPEGVSVPEKGVEYVARNLWVGKRGWLVRYYHQGEIHEEWFDSRDAVLERYPKGSWQKVRTMA